MKIIKRIPLSIQFTFLALLLQVTFAILLVRYFDKASTKNILEREILTQTDLTRIMVSQSENFLNGIASRAQAALANKKIENDAELVAISKYAKIELSYKMTERILNTAALKDFSLAPSFIDRLRVTNNIQWQAFSHSDKLLINSTVPGAPAILTLMLSVNSGILLVDFKMDSFQRTFSAAKDSILFAVDHDGNLLAHQNEKMAFSGKNLSYIPIVSMALDQNQNFGQLIFNIDETSEKFISSFQKSHWGVIVFALQSQNRLLSSKINIINHLGVLLLLYLSSSGLILIILFNQGLRPIRSISEELASGHFVPSDYKEIQSEFKLLIEALSRFIHK